jgi:large subunit ribosomal protein L23
MNYERLMHVLQAPYMTEKLTMSGGDYAQYGFKVLPSATKTEIRKAVEQLFNVKVRSVRTCNQKGKQKRFGKIMGKHQDWKKAYVLLEKDQVIDMAAKA